MFNYLRSSVFALTVPLILPSLFSNLSCKIALLSNDPDTFTCIFQLLPVDFTDARACQLI